MIRVEEYPNDLYFIKFYPKNYQDSENKYKIRTGDVHELNRIISTCIKHAKSILDNIPEASFGFYGQWDEKDIISDTDTFDDVVNVTSQRYKIYKEAIFRKIDSNKFKFYYEEEKHYGNHAYKCL